VAKNKTVINMMCNKTEPLACNSTIILEYKGSLSNTGELIVLKDNDGRNILEIIYKNTWYPTTNGGGYSLIPNPDRKSKPINSFRIPDDFMPNHLFLGTPGKEELRIITMQDQPSKSSNVYEKSYLCLKRFFHSLDRYLTHVKNRSGIFLSKDVIMRVDFTSSLAQEMSIDWAKLSHINGFSYRYITKCLLATFQ